MARESVREYYGKTLQNSADLKTDACTTTAAPPPHISTALADVHDDVAARYYGCGIVLPPCLDGLNILDLGAGAGRDVFALAKLAGSEGRVTGVDMTPEQLDFARAHEDWHQERFGYAHRTTRFLEGELEHLDQLDLEPGSFDLVVSNCVINLCSDKPAVFRAAHDLLKPGGEIYFSDVYADRRVPEPLLKDPVLHGECLSGALYWNDFLTIARNAGFIEPRVVEQRPLAVLDNQIKTKLDPVRFASVTVRLFKLEDLETACEDYGQAVIYKGGVEGMESVFKLDGEHHIEKGRVFPVCGNTKYMLMNTRFSPYFELIGKGASHFGQFPGCTAPNVFDAPGDAGPAAAPVGGCC